MSDKPKFKLRLAQTESGDWYLVDADYHSFEDDEFNDNVNYTRVNRPLNNPSDIVITDFYVA